MKSKGSQQRTDVPEDAGHRQELHVSPNGGNSDSDVKCVVCAKLGRILDCCKDLRSPCLICAKFHQLLNREVEQNDAAWRERYDDLEAQNGALQNTPQELAQETSDYTESLKQQAEEVDAEDKRLKKILEEQKEALKHLRNQLSEREAPLEFAIKESKKGKKGNK